MIQHNVPFYKNDELGVQCMQVAMKCVIEYFLHKEFTLTELDALTGRTDLKWTFTTQLVAALYDLNIDLMYYSKTELEPFLEGEAFIRAQFGKDAEIILQHADIPAGITAVKKILKHSVFTKKILTVKDIEGHLDMGHIPMILIDYNTLIGKNNGYHGHFVVVTGYDADHIYFHESGPKGAMPHAKVLKDIFIHAFNANGTDNDCVIVKGIQ